MRLEFISPMLNARRVLADCLESCVERVCDSFDTSFCDAMLVFLDRAKGILQLTNKTNNFSSPAAQRLTPPVHSSASPEHRDWHNYSLRSSRLKVPLRSISNFQSRPCSRWSRAGPSRRTMLDSVRYRHKTMWLCLFEYSSEPESFGVELAD